MRQKKQIVAQMSEGFLKMSYFAEKAQGIISDQSPFVWERTLFRLTQGSRWISKMVNFCSCLQEGLADRLMVTYSRLPCLAPWCVAVRCTGLSPARIHWCRWTNLSRTQAPQRTGSPPSCKHTHPWTGHLGCARKRRQSHTASLCSLPERTTKRRSC